MTQIYIYSGIAFAAGFIIAWIIRTMGFLKLKKSFRDVNSFFETEKLRKEFLQKENTHLYKTNDAVRDEYSGKINQLREDNKRLIEDILLLQKSNEETESLLKAGEPEIYNLKIKLIEANNETARYKSLSILK